jgi:hypothetical protein
MTAPTQIATSDPTAQTAGPGPSHDREATSR